MSDSGEVWARTPRGMAILLGIVIVSLIGLNQLEQHKSANLAQPVIDKQLLYVIETSKPLEDVKACVGEMRALGLGMQQKRGPTHFEARLTNSGSALDGWSHENRARRKRLDVIDANGMVVVRYYGEQGDAIRSGELAHLGDCVGPQANWKTPA